jgi:ankyrin repeat protein
MEGNTCLALYLQGRNLALAEHLLRLGADPNYSFFAAAWNDNIEAIDLLARYGADIEDRSNPFETPFIGAVAWRRLKPAEALARHGANVNAVDRKGRIALHILLRKGAEYNEIAKVIALGGRLDIADAAGRTAAEIMARKRDQRFRSLAQAKC